QFMVEKSRQLRRDRRHSLDWDAQLTIVDGAAPGRCLGHIEEGLSRIKHDGNAAAGRNAQSAHQVVVLCFESRDKLPPQLFRTLLAFISQGEVAALALGKICFSSGFTLGFCQKFFHYGIGTKRKRALPAADGVAAMIRGKLGVSKNCEG